MEEKEKEKEKEKKKQEGEGDEDCGPDNTMLQEKKGWSRELQAR